MKSSKNSLLTLGIIILSLMLLAVAVFSVALLLPINTNVASADDNFEIIFPKNDYFQSKNPTLIAANENNLLIYDKTNSTLFVRNNVQVGTYSYPIQLDGVTDLFAIGDIAFLATEDLKYYTLDLTNQSSTLVDQTLKLTTPSTISYLNSDGKYLYAKSVWGEVSIYDENMKIAFGVDNEKNALFTGDHVIVGEQSTLCLFITKLAYPYFVSYNFESAQTTEIKIDTQVQSASLASVIFAMVDGNIVCIDKTNGKTLFDTQISPDSYCAYSNNLYTIEGEKIYIYNLNQDLSGLSLFSTISMSGADEKHLDSPLDVTYFDNSVVVADSQNKRVSFIKNATTSADCVALDAEPIALASSKSLYVALSNGTITKMTDKQIEQTYTLEGVRDLCYLDKLYALSNNGVYTNLGTSMIKIASIVNARKIACNTDGTNVYVLLDDGIVCINQNGKILYKISHNLSDSVDFAVDYQGNFFIAYPHEIVKFENCFNSLLEISRTSCQNANTKATLTSASLVETTLYFSASECFVAKMSVTAKTKDSYVGATVPQIDETLPFHFAKLKDGVSSICVDSSTRQDSASLQDNSVILIFDNLQKGNLNYAFVAGKLVLVDASSYDTLSANSTNEKYKLLKTATLYTIPHVEAGSVSLQEGSELVGLDDACSYMDNGWLRVEHNNKQYYVKSSDVEKVVEDVITPPEQKVQYGRAKAERVGGTVGIYATKDTNLSPILQIVDGTKVEVLAIEGDYVYVKCENTLGYMLSSQIELEGLTTVQIVAIALSAIVLVAGSIIFASIYLTKKKHDEQNQQN